MSMKKRTILRYCYYTSIFITLLFACFALAASLAQFVSPIHSNSLTLFGLFIPIILIINALFLLYWLIRFKIWIIIPIIAIGINYSYLIHIFRFAPHREYVEEDNPHRKLLTIGTYNVHGFNSNIDGYYCKKAGEYMKAQNADIVCFQEFGIKPYFNEDSLRHALAHWNYSLIPVPQNKQAVLHLAVFSKYPILRGEYFTYSDSENTALWCDIDIEGDTVRLFNIHLQTTSVSQTKLAVESEIKKEDISGMERAVKILTDEMEANYIKRAYQADYISTQIERSPYPIILCGDFNSIPSSYAYRRVKGDKLIDGFGACGHGYMYTFRYFKHLFRIDYIFTTQEFEGIDYYSSDLDYSDHNPVIMKVVF